MRSLIIVFGGFVLWGSLLSIARFFGEGSSAAAIRAAGIFTVAWLALAVLNLWFGMERAGYSFFEELPVFLLIFLLPVSVAMFVTWKWL